jgi:hypothetical protein
MESTVDNKIIICTYNDEDVNDDSDDDNSNELSDNEFNIFIQESKNIKKESTNKNELILKYLKYLGLNKFNLISRHVIRTQVKEIIERQDIDYCSIFSSHINKDGSVDDRHMRLFIKINNMFNIVNFTWVQDLTTEGYWNKIQLYKDCKNKHYIFRTSLNKKELSSEPDDEYLYRSFEENLKHIILYILLKYYYSDTKYKIVPEVYYFGLHVNALTKEKTFITCMEVGGITLEKYFESMPENYLEMRKILYTTFRSLELLNDLGLDFKHGDLKSNNILMTRENKPMIIDFGKSRFKLDDLIFESLNETSTFYEDPYMNVTHDMMQLIYSLFIPKKISLIFSEQIMNITDYKINVYKIFNFVKNKNSCALEGKIMEQIAREKYKRLFIPYQNFYLKYKLFAGVNLNELKKSIPNINFTIRSSELAENLGIDCNQDENLFSTYNKKCFTSNSPRLKNFCPLTKLN